MTKTTRKSSDFPTVITFYTPEYREVANRLIASCQDVGIPVIATKKDSHGVWVKNCAMKGPFVYQQLKALKKPVLWLDADAEVVKYPALFDGDMDCDIATWKMFLRGCLLSGTLYLNYTKPALALARRWARRCKRNPGVWDQRHLTNVYNEMQDVVKWRKLPQGYCKIFDRKWKDKDQTAYIIHHQASRRMKRRLRK